VVVCKHRSLEFRVSATITVDADYLEDDVLDAARAALEDAFSFARRDFGQPVALSQVEAVIQVVAGVIAVAVDGLWVHPGTRMRQTLLRAEAPAAGDDATTAQGAQLLTYVFVTDDLQAAS
jgi:hypothetical protein